MPLSPQSLTTSSNECKSNAEIELFPIVGIGASAGGLEAFEQFLENTPEDSNMAYVIIQHLDPNQKGMLPELLQRVTKMMVFQVKDRMKVFPNCVYVIPPNKSLSISKGVLHLSEAVEVKGLRLPIDFFLRSLADDRQEYSIGVILSGMGSDGSSGIRAIKERNGIVMVQDPPSAKFDSMPRNAMDAVLADIVAPASELPKKLCNLFKPMPLFKLNPEIDIQDANALFQIIELLRIHTGNDFSLYKKNTIYRRIERRMIVHKISTITSYVHFLQENPTETTILFKELLIGVTHFFRDPAVWMRLEEDILPVLIAKQEVGAILRAWIPGCSTGEEAYSLSIVFKETLKRVRPHDGISLQIFATDLDNEAIEIARKGTYPENISKEVSKNRLNRFFNRTRNGYRANAEIREMIVFAQHNIVMHPPFTRLNILSCRNLLIYMNADLQKKLINLFYYSIQPEGYLFLGSSETIGTQNQYFETEDAKLKIYRRSIVTQKRTLMNFPSSLSQANIIHKETNAPINLSQNIEVLANQLLLQHFSPPGVLVNEDGDIIYISGRTGKYLEPAVGKANLNIFAMLREGLRKDFPPAFHQAICTKETIVLHNIKVGSNGDSQVINVNIQWIEKPEPLNGKVMIIFRDIPDSSSIKRKTNKGKKMLSILQQSDLEEELNDAREEMQKTFEEMQTSQEELKSTNEELQSTNEELQSTNEELTSSKEEMQSLNEELQTVNAELQTKVDDFSRVSNDMKNLLNSTEIATLFLDKKLNIRRFTNQSTKIFKLIKSDIGRPFTDLVSDLIYLDLSADAHEVLKTLSFIKKQIPTKDGRWFSIRIMPYRTYDERVDGVVITFFNITDMKQLESELYETDTMHRLILNSCSDVIFKLSSEFIIQEFNPEAERFFGKTYKEVIQQNFIQLLVPEMARKKTEKELIKLLKNGVCSTYHMQIQTSEGNVSTMELSANILFNMHKKPSGIILVSKKINNRS